MLKIIDEEWNWKNVTLKKLLEEGNTPSYWKDFFEDQKEEIDKISSYLETRRGNIVIYPSPNLIFRTFSLPLEKIKVVILGQDPYHDGAATGLCFSVPPKNKINPSLQNIYKELENEGFSPKKDGNLEPWLKQGVFLINTALTVEKGDPESHTDIWVNFTEKLLEYISTSKNPIVWILMGKKALDFRENIKSDNHLILGCSHPSPSSAHKTLSLYPSFFGSDIFKDCNEFLELNKFKKIVW